MRWSCTFQDDSTHTAGSDLQWNGCLGVKTAPSKSRCVFRNLWQVLKTWCSQILFNHSDWIQVTLLRKQDQFGPVLLWRQFCKRDLWPQGVLSWLHEGWRRILVYRKAKLPKLVGAEANTKLTFQICIYIYKSEHNIYYLIHFINSHIEARGCKMREYRKTPQKLQSLPGIAGLEATLCSSGDKWSRTNILFDMLIRSKMWKEKSHNTSLWAP